MIYQRCHQQPHYHNSIIDSTMETEKIADLRKSVKNILECLSTIKECVEKSQAKATEIIEVAKCIEQAAIVKFYPALPTDIYTNGMPMRVTQDAEGMWLESFPYYTSKLPPKAVHYCPQYNHGWVKYEEQEISQFSFTGFSRSIQHFYKYAR